jgi:excinuclease ABC subunit C
MINITGLKTKLKNLPDSPGVYQFLDSRKKVLYVGKAKSLKSRVRQYFRLKQNSGKTSIMVSKISGLEIIVTDSEVEALILELNLIKSLKPRYNVNLKDDKTYPYIRITKEPFPRIFPTRKKISDGSKYFGPFTDVSSMRYSLKIIKNIFTVRSCNLNLTEEGIQNKKFKLCLDYHIKKCDGPCEGFVSQEEYGEMIKQAAKLLNGKTSALCNELKEEMLQYSQNEQFEKAGKTRKKLDAISVYSSKQKMVSGDLEDRDVFAVAKEDNDACGMVLKIRDGKVIGKSHFYFSNALEIEEKTILENFISNYYTSSDFIPDEIFLPFEIENPDTIRSYLENKFSELQKNEPQEKNIRFNIIITVPKIGDNAKLVAMVRANAKLMLDELKLAKLKKEYTVPSLEAIKRDLGLKNIPRRIECFDISHIQGTDTVASMVVFHDAKPRKKDYRKYKLRSALNEAGEPDDFLSMREVIYRRYRKNAEKELSSEAENNTEADYKFLPLPDLIIIDGGKGQLSSALRVLTDIGIEIENNDAGTAEENTKTKKGVYIIGLAKRLEEVFFPGDTLPRNIPKSSSGLRLIQKIRDEAHRFAVTYHKTLRDKRTLHTELTEIKGVGEKTAQKLLTLFGSVEDVKRLVINSYDEIKRAAGKSVAASLRKHFSENENQTI